MFALDPLYYQHSLNIKFHRLLIYINFLLSDLQLTRSDGRDVQLEEDPDLQLPFLLPEDGYSCDVVNSVPSGLTEFARPLVAESN